MWSDPDDPDDPKDNLAAAELHRVAVRVASGTQPVGGCSEAINGRERTGRRGCHLDRTKQGRFWAVGAKMVLSGVLQCCNCSLCCMVKHCCISLYIPLYILYLVLYISLRRFICCICLSVQYDMKFPSVDISHEFPILPRRVAPLTGWQTLWDQLVVHVSDHGWCKLNYFRVIQQLRPKNKT